MKDRRIRLRPKNGARALYYSSVGVVNTRGSNLFDKALPYLNGGKPLPNFVPNLPNIISGIGQGISNLPKLASGLLSNITGGISNFTSNFPANALKFADKAATKAITSFFGGSMFTAGRSFGKGQGLSAVGSNINILEPLAQTDGLVFPFTPTITYSQAVDYASNDVVHSNQEFLAYTRTKAPTISISGQFVVQNSFEASYALACIHFLRTVTKMSFGQNSANPGTPPPIILFSGYGEFMFPEVPVIITGFSIDYPNDVDYIIVPNSDTVVPALFTIQISLVVQNNPDTLREFSLEQFRKGSLMKQGGWI